ncbi:MAG: hypothetical protein LQ341_004705 [Variospora aurantia]|nr:MAG: hypothetical protein LQ341_004705 [Variospora aurantia]
MSRPRPTFRGGFTKSGEETHPNAPSFVTPSLSGKSDTLFDKISPEQQPSTSSVHFGSYTKTKGSSGHGRPSQDPSREQLQHLLSKTEDELETYGINETRDGFFDATFYRPLRRNRQQMMKRASETLPLALQTHHPLSLKYLVPRQWSELKDSVRQIATTRSGLELFKSFLGFFVAYIVCLIPASRQWLGSHNYILPLSALVNHAGRPIGSQIDGAFLTIVGTAAGLGWGSLAMYVSTSTTTAQNGYGGVLAAFLVIFTVTVAVLRCTFIRLYQAVISAGIAICYLCLADTSENVGWRKIFNYGIPLVFPHDDDLSLRRDLSWHFVRLSTAIRDFTIEISVSRFAPDDVRSLRNLAQSVIRALLSVKPDTQLFDIPSHTPGQENASVSVTQKTLVDRRNPVEQATPSVLELIGGRLASTTKGLIDAMAACIASCDAVIIDLGGQRRYIRPCHHPQQLSQALQQLSASIDSFDAEDAALIADPTFPPMASTIPEAVALFLFVHPLRQAADKVQAFSEKVLQMQQSRLSWAFRLPSYPLRKQFIRTNRQVRHDRGGLTAGFYFRTKAQLDRTMEDLQSRPFVPISRKDVPGGDGIPDATTTEKQQTAATPEPRPGQTDQTKFRYKVWEILHRMQGFESRFALKIVLVTTSLSVPAWLEQSSDWWNANDVWWTVVAVWLMTHPRVSGTFQDLATRLLCVVLGAVWGGLAYAAGNGNPYVMAIFAAIFMIPMIHRYTQSPHPRSGIIGCISFTVVSLSTIIDQDRSSTVTIAWTRGLAFAVAITTSLLTNWVLWPFVARHELRKSLSAMMLHLAILYRGVISKYILYVDGQEPSAQDIERSEMLEGRLREGFVRIRQLLELTRHEIRLRAPFDPLPYSALIESCERFFEHLVEVRQSSLYFQPSLRASNAIASDGLISYRRDAVAVVLMNLYILASALRANKPIPQYMPSAAAARKRLMVRMAALEAMSPQESENVGQKDGRRWADVYRFAFSAALTDIVEQMQQLRKYIREVTGEAEFALGDSELTDVDAK